MVTIEASSVNQEIQQIMNNGANPVHFDWSATIIANKKTIPIQKILGIHIVRNFDTNFADQVVVEVMIPLGTFSNQVYPYKDDLMMTLYKHSTGELGTSTMSSPDIENHKLRATLMDASDHILEGNSRLIQNEVGADLSSMKRVKFQLVEPALEQIRMQSVGSIMRKTTPGDAVKFFMTAISNNIQVDGKVAIKGVEMVPPDNTTVRDHILLPHGLKFSDVPGWIHEHMGGVYNGGFGFYLQNGHWYVYPLYNVDRWNKTPKNLTLINIPQNSMPGMDRTYRKTNNQLIVLLTGENKHLDDTEGLQLNKGNGLRFTAASAVLGEFGTSSFGVAKDNKYKITRSKNNTEFIAAPRKTKLNNIQMSDRRITDNNFYELGKMARRLGSHIQVAWENSDPGSLYPGMPTRYIYSANGNLNVIYGTLLRAHSYIGMTNPGLLNGSYICNTALTVFLDNGTRINTTTNVGNQSPT